MKTLRKVDIESMALELSVLQHPEKILGGYDLPEVVVTGIMPSGVQLVGISYEEVSAFLYSLKTSLWDSIANEVNPLPFTGTLADCYNNMTMDLIDQIWGYTGSLYFSVRNTTPSSAAPTIEMKLFGEDGNQIAFSNSYGGWW